MVSLVILSFTCLVTSLVLLFAVCSVLLFLFLLGAWAGTAGAGIGGVGTAGVGTAVMGAAGASSRSFNNDCNFSFTTEQISENRIT